MKVWWVPEGSLKCHWAQELYASSTRRASDTNMSNVGCRNKTKPYPPHNTSSKLASATLTNSAPGADLSKTKYTSDDAAKAPVGLSLNVVIGDLLSTVLQIFQHLVLINIY